MKTFVYAIALLLLACAAQAQSTNAPLRTGTYVIFRILDTNKVEVGTLTTTGGKERWRVMEYWYVTNTVAVMEYKNQQRMMLLEVDKGPLIGERREPKEAMMPPMPK